MTDKTIPKDPRVLASYFSRGLCCCFVIAQGSISIVSEAQGPKENLIPPEVANQPPDNRTAHRHSDPEDSCCKPCVQTAADRDPDVAKRPCFVRALNKARVNSGIFGYPHGQTISGDRLPEGERIQFEGYLERLLNPSVLPEVWSAADRWALVTTTSTQDPWVEVASWDAGIGKIKTSRVRRSASIKIRFQVLEKDRLSVRARPAPGPDFDPDVEQRDQKGIFFEAESLHRVLTGIFQLPFDTKSDYFVRGRTREFEGIRVFVGNVFANNRSPSDPHWYDRFSLLVTDSDPQYMGVTIDFRAEVEERRSAP